MMTGKSTFNLVEAIQQKSQQNERIPKNFDTQLPMAFRIYFAFSFHCYITKCVQLFSFHFFFLLEV